MILSAAFWYFEITRWTFVKVVQEECKIRLYDRASDCVGRLVKPHTCISFEMKHLREENCVKMISLLLGLIRSTELAT